MKSLFGKLNRKDIRRAFGLAIPAALTYMFTQMCMGTVPNMELLKQAGAVFGGTGGMYILKNIFTNSRDEFGKREGCHGQD